MVTNFFTRSHASKERINASNPKKEMTKKIMSERARQVNVRNKLWKAERPILAHEMYQKGFKRNPFPPGSIPPQGYVTPTQMLHLLQMVDFKKTPPGHQRRYDKMTRHTSKIPHGVTGSGGNATKSFHSDIWMRSKSKKKSARPYPAGTVPLVSGHRVPQMSAPPPIRRSIRKRKS